MERRAVMLSLIGIGLAILCAGVAWGARPELNESQRVRLETAGDGSPTIDEAAFYALLENAADWPDDAGAAGAVVPDYGALSEEPEAWRGRPCLIEGRLEMAVPEIDLARSGWDDVRGLVVRTAPEGPGSEKGRPIVLYLTDPPKLEPSWINEDVLKQRGWRVRAVGRFYKLVDWQTRGGDRSTYPVFVGKALSQFGPAEGGSGDGGWGNAFSPGSVAAFGLVLVMAAAYLIYRVIAMRRQFRGRSRLDEYRREREAARARAEADTVGQHDALTDLPDDPAAAMEILAERRGKEHHEEAGPQQDTGPQQAPDAQDTPDPRRDT